MQTNFLEIAGASSFKSFTSDLYFGALLRFLFEGYLEIAVSVTIGLISMEWTLDEGFGVLYCNVFTLVMASILVFLPLYIWFFYRRNLDIMDETGFQERYGSLYDGLNLKN